MVELRNWGTFQVSLLLMSLFLRPPLREALSSTADGFCDDLNDHLSVERDKIININSTVRKVDLKLGEDVEECLNVDRLSDPPPCRTLEYALHGDDTDVDNFENAASDLVIHLGSGEYRSFANTTRAVNSHRVAFIGNGSATTIVKCGASGQDDIPCNFLNFQIRNSSHVLVSGLTFTGCGPITSSLYVGQSDYVFIENCIFENDTSPAALFYITPNVKISNCSFYDNHPVELKLKVVHSTCYLPLGEENDAFFLDNRTSAGGMTFYSEDTTTRLIIENGIFENNSARPDLDVGLIRRSGRYGHGGAVSLRLLNTTNSGVCIRDSVFLENLAEAHAGALAVTVAGSSASNKIVVLRSRFLGNRCEIENCTGGAVGIYFFSGTLLNTILFLDCNFTNNEARSSGAMVLSTSVSAEQIEGESDVLRLVNCQFRNNRAFYEGTALGVFSLSQTNQIGIPVELNNCNFFRNFGTDGSIDTTAVTVYRVLLTILGNTTFRENVGGGATLLSSRLDVRGSALFDFNTAVFGAGVAMSGRSLMLLYENSSIMFTNNFAYELGAGLYVEDPSSDFTLSILNTGCFIRYHTNLVDIPPYQWKTSVIFRNNTAAEAGAAIYANDVSRCLWVGTECPTQLLSKMAKKPTIFDLSPECSPFEFENNTVDIPGGGLPRGEIINQVFATDPTVISATTNYSMVGYGERLAVRLSSEDNQGNFREAVWSVSAPSEPQSFGALSSNNTVYTYNVPSKSELLQNPSDLSMNKNNTNFSITFALFLNDSSSQSVSVDLSLSGSGCHPGYVFDDSSQTCVCQNDGNIIRCDSNNRYFYAREGLWVSEEKGEVSFSNTVPGFLNCTRQGTLPGCQFQFDNQDRQCASGREGTLCGTCQSGFGVTFDLRYCQRCSVYGVLLYLLIVILTPVVSLAILYFDFPLPNELKGVIFYLQVVGVIYRSTPYLNERDSSGAFFDFIVNVLGFAMPFPLCFHEKLSVIPVALLGYLPPGLALLTAIAYGICARYFKLLSHREQYGFHGFYILLLFIYKYIIDTSFIFVSCTNVSRKQVFLYQGRLECYKYPFVLLVILGSSLLILFGVVLPLYILKLIYAPGKMIYVHNALTYGLKNKRRYLWYGLWDIWRRLLFVATSLLISITTPSIVLLIQCVLIMFCLWVLCFFRPYKKYYINLIEALMILALFSTTLSVYDRDNDFHVGVIVGYMTLAVPYIYGILFILYRISRVIWRKISPTMKSKKTVGAKVERMQDICSAIANVIKGNTLSFVGERTEGTNELYLQQDRRNSELEQSFALDLRESLLEEQTDT